METSSKHLLLIDPCKTVCLCQSDDDFANTSQPLGLPGFIKYAIRVSFYIVLKLNFGVTKISVSLNPV